MDERTDGRTDGWTGRRVDRWTGEEKLRICTNYSLGGERNSTESMVKQYQNVHPTPFDPLRPLDTQLAMDNVEVLKDGSSMLRKI